MITTRFYLDCRAVVAGQPAPLRLVISVNNSRAAINSPWTLLPNQWDNLRQAVVNCSQRVALNNLLLSFKVKVDTIIFRLFDEDRLAGLNASGIKDLVMSELYPDTYCPVHSPYRCFTEFVNSKSGRTRDIYAATLHKILAFSPKFDKMRWEDLSVSWLSDFDAFLATSAPSRNSRNIHFRNLRAVFNRAIDDEVTRCYPFRKFKLRPVATRKRAMSVEQLRKIASAPLPQWQCQYRDLWLLTFCLIGINFVDLCSLTEVDAFGRVNYTRAKTHKPYSIKVEPEAMAIIERYRGSERLLSQAERYKTYRVFYHALCRGLRAVRDSLNAIDDGVRIEELSTYWARHSWATCAAALDIPKETIAAALGHGGHSVTDVYIDFDMRKVDAANREVLDWVFKGCSDQPQVL